MTSRWLHIVLLVLAGLPLIIFPAQILANVMSIAGHGHSDASFIVRFVSMAFMATSTAYPIVYLASIVGYTVSSIKKNASWAWKFVTMPYWSLALIAVFFVLWLLIDLSRP